MKLKELLESGDYSAFRKTRATFPNYYDTFSQELYNGEGAISYEHYDAVENSPRAHMIVIREWLCTDQHVGYYIYFIDDEPVCTMCQEGRKCYPSWHFISRDSFFKMRNFFDDMRPKCEEETFDSIPILDDEDLRLNCDPELSDCHIYPGDYGLSVASYVMNSLDVILSRDEKLEDEWTIKYLNDVLDDHKDFMTTLTDQSDIEYAEKAAESNITKIKKILEKCNEN